MERDRPVARHTTLSAALPPRLPMSQPTAKINISTAPSTDLPMTNKGKRNVAIHLRATPPYMCIHRPVELSTEQHP